MTDVARLEALLARVTVNRAMPRPARAVVTPEAPAAAAHVDAQAPSSDDISAVAHGHATLHGIPAPALPQPPAPPAIEPLAAPVVAAPLAAEEPEPFEPLPAEAATTDFDEPLLSVLPAAFDDADEHEDLPPSMGFDEFDEHEESFGDASATVPPAAVQQASASPEAAAVAAAARLDVAKPEAAKPEAAKPDVAEFEAAEFEAAEFEAAEFDAGGAALSAAPVSPSAISPPSEPIARIAAPLPEPAPATFGGLLRRTLALRPR